MRKRIFITLFFCLSSFIASAQIDNSRADEGSVYSQFGLGLPTDYGSSSADGMGLWGVSHIETLVPGMANPAQWGSTVYGMASGGLALDNYSAEDNFGTATNSNVSINHFQIQLPLYKGELGLSASFSPYTERSFEVFKRGEEIIGSGSVQDTLNFQTVNVGQGGINRLELGLGWKINKYISVGYAASLLYSSTDNQFTTFFNPTQSPDSTYAPVNTTLQTSGSGFGNRFGAFLTIPSLAGGNDALNIGMAITLPTTIDAEKVQESPFLSRDPEDSESDVEETIAKGDIKTPLGITAGLTYQPSERVAISTEGRFQQWSEYENEVNTSSGNIQFTDRLKMGAGIKYYPFVSGSDKFLSQFKYRLGATYDSGHLEINGENIESLRLSAGLGILSPTRVSGFNSSIDFSFYYEMRGTKSQNLVKENIWGAKITLNLAELFFFRPKLQ